MNIQNPITKIIIQTPQKFEKTIKGFEEIGSQDNYFLKNGKSSTTDKFTRRANTCGILAMSNGKNTMIKHIAPETKPKNFVQQLDEIVRNFKAETGKLSAVLSGGWCHNMATRKQEAINSSTMLSEMGAVLDKNGANLTMIACKTNPTFTDSLAVTKNAFILSHDPILGAKGKAPEFKNGSNEAEINKVLDENYYVNELDDTHTIYFEG